MNIFCVKAAKYIYCKTKLVIFFPDIDKQLITLLTRHPLFSKNPSFAPPWLVVGKSACNFYSMELAEFIQTSASFQ